MPVWRLRAAAARLSVPGRVRKKAGCCPFSAIPGKGRSPAVFFPRSGGENRRLCRAESRAFDLRCGEKKRPIAGRALPNAKRSRERRPQPRLWVITKYSARCRPISWLCHEQLVKKVFLTSWWTGEQAPPPLPPLPVFAKNLSDFRAQKLQGNDFCSGK